MNKNIFAGLVVLAINVTAHADVIKCTFTEPFVTTVYNIDKQTLTEIDVEDKQKVTENVSFEIKSAGSFELVNEAGKVLQKIELNGRGSDGMSDTTYPFEVTDTSMDGLANNGVGGCTSNHLKSTGNEAQE